MGHASSCIYCTYNCTIVLFFTKCSIVNLSDHINGQVHGQGPAEAAAAVRGRRGRPVRHRPKQTPPRARLQAK